MAKKLWQLETETIITLNIGFNKFLHLSLKLPNGTFKLCKPLSTLSHFLPLLEISKGQRQSKVRQIVNRTLLAAITEVWESEGIYHGENATQSDSVLHTNRLNTLTLPHYMWVMIK